MYAIRKNEQYSGTLKIEDDKITFYGYDGTNYIHFFPDIEVAEEIYNNDILAGVMYLILASEHHKELSIYNSETDLDKCVQAMFRYFIDKYSISKLEKVISDKTFKQLFTLLYSNDEKSRTPKSSPF